MTPYVIFSPMVPPVVDNPHVPIGVKPLVDALTSRLHPQSIWQFGSRARGDHRPDSDWDLVVVMPDGTPVEQLDPLVGWSIQNEVGVPATIILTTSRDFAESWGAPNTLGFVLAREGRRLVG